VAGVVSLARSTLSPTAEETDCARQQPLLHLRHHLVITRDDGQEGNGTRTVFFWRGTGRPALRGSSQLAQGLRAAHFEPIDHRDVGPAYDGVPAQPPLQRALRPRHQSRPPVPRCVSPSAARARLRSRGTAAWRTGIANAPPGRVPWRRRQRDRRDRPRGCRHALRDSWKRGLSPRTCVRLVRRSAKRPSGYIGASGMAWTRRNCSLGRAPQPLRSPRALAKSASIARVSRRLQRPLGPEGFFSAASSTCAIIPRTPDSSGRVTTLFRWMCSAVASSSSAASRTEATSAKKPRTSSSRMVARHPFPKLIGPIRPHNQIDPEAEGHPVQQTQSVSDRSQDFVLIDAAEIIGVF
jgi:hypothetical protein